MSKYTGQEDIVVGSAIANRHHRQTEGLIGFFVNTQANRTLLNRSQSYEGLIHQVHQDQIAAQLHQDLPFEKLVDELGVERDTSRHPVFQVMFGVEGFGNNSNTNDRQKGLIKPYQGSSAYEVEKFDLSIFIDDRQEELRGQISYATSLFHADTIARLIDHYTYLLDQLTEAPKSPYSHVSLLGPEEYDKIVYQWNVTEKEYPKDRTIHEMFEEQVERTPENIALVYEGQQLTYRELNEKSNQLARHIRGQYKQRKKQELQSNTLVALCLDRSLEMVIGILGVLKAGGAYVPMDPSYPQDRVDYLLEDTKAELVLTHQQVSESSTLQLAQDKVLYIDLMEDLYQQENTANLPPHSMATDLAYVIYTSGTTGKPKGVMVEHGNYLQLDNANNYNCFYNNRTLWTNYTFDVSVFELFNALLMGSQLHVLNNEVRYNSEKFFRFLKYNRIDYTYIPPFFIKDLVNYLNTDSLDNLSKILTGVDKVYADDANKIASQNIAILNGYGPTETTICSTAYLVDSQVNRFNTLLPIGTPLSNVKAYVLDPSKNPVPIGVIGELYIAGAGLSRGYLNNKDLTAERFISNPFATESDQAKGYTRLYKTGDLVRWLSDGNLEYIGRNDEQVKIRGYRIELGEVEHALLQIVGIKQACVLAKERKTETGITKYLVGYYVMDSDSNDTLTQAFITESLSKSLPDYMVPAALVSLESFPLTINGKLDRRALPDPDFSSSPDEYVAPSTETEKAIVKIWEEVLGVVRVGVTDDFFRIGGNSILAIQVSRRISKIIGYEVGVAAIFKYKAISQLLAQREVGATTSVIPSQMAAPMLSFVQQHIWKVHSQDHDVKLFNIPILFELRSDTDLAAVKYAIAQIVNRHSILRTTIFSSGDGEVTCEVHNRPLAVEEKEVPWTTDYNTLIQQSIRHQFDLGLEYPVRVTIFNVQQHVTSESVQNQKIIILVTVHPIAFDNRSVKIFLSELEVFYNEYFRKGDTNEVPVLKIQYNDFSVWEKSYFKGTMLESKLAYWKEKLSGFMPLELPTDFVRPDKPDYRKSVHFFRINSKTYLKLTAMAARHHVSLHSVLLAGFNILLSKYARQNDIITGSPLEVNATDRTQGIIGPLTPGMACRTILDSRETFQDFVVRVHGEYAESKLQADVPFVTIMDELGIENTGHKNPVFQVMFEVRASQAIVNADQLHHFNILKNASIENNESVDINVVMDEHPGHLEGSLYFSTALFHSDTISQLVHHFNFVLDKLSDEPSRRYEELSLLEPEDFEKIVHQWNVIDTVDSKDLTICDLFQEQVKRTPNKTALWFGEQKLTYGELNTKSNQLARKIRTTYLNKMGKELRPDEYIAICVERSIEAIIGILAILKAGAAYVPIDPAFSKERFDHILNDSGSEIVLTTRQLMEGVLLVEDENLLFIDLSEELYKIETVTNLESYSKGMNLAYLMYPSTGTPFHSKGVMVEHSTVIRLFLTTKYQFNFGPQDVWTMSHSHALDGGIWEMWGALTLGGSLIILSREQVNSADAIVDACKTYHVTVLNQTPFAFYRFAERVNNRSSNDAISLRYVIVGGGFLDVKRISSWWTNQVTSKMTAKLIYMHSVSESSGYLTYKELLRHEVNHFSIGKPLNDVQAYILDANRNPVPVGVTGELYVGGAGLVRGYLNVDELTDDRFITNPFATDIDHRRGHTRLYRTGDLVRWMADKNLAYVGRMDDQVKVRVIF